MKSYCVKDERVTEYIPGSEKYVKTKNNRTMMQCICIECGIIKSKFVKNQGN